jgi:hypothetical protein
MRSWTTAIWVGLVASCGGERVVEGELPSNGVRVEMPRVYFNRWTDFLSLQAGLSTRCRFLDPFVVDDSTSWPPLQVFWVIYDNPADVKDGALIEDTFFAGDVLTVEDFEARAGKDALGFKYLPPSQRTFLDIEEMVVHEGGRSLEATLGAPLRVKLRVDASTQDSEDGTCTVQTRWCEADADPCEPAPLTAIEVTLNGLYLVQDVQYR